MFVAATDSPPPEDLCGTDPRWACEQVWQLTGGNRTLTRIVDWLVARPLTVLAILAVAWLVQWVLRRVVRRGVRRMLIPPELVRKPLDAMGVQLDANQAEAERRQARAESIANATAGAVAVLVWAFAVVIAATAVNIQLGPLIAATGVAGVALGFGAQSLVRDCINGFFILVEDQYGIGDSVDLGEAIGKVERISLRATVLRSVDGSVWHVPNGQIIRVGNRSQLWSVAVVDVAVGYAADLTAVQELLGRVAVERLEAGDLAADVIDTPTVLGVETLGVDGVTLRVSVKTQPGRQWAVERALRVAFSDALVANNVPLPPRATGFRRDDDLGPA